MIYFRVKYKDQDLILKQNILSQITYEECIDDIFREPKKTYEFILWMYSLFYGNGIIVTIDELCEYIDEHEGYIKEFFNGIVIPEQKKKEDTEDKKKVKQKKEKG